METSEQINELAAALAEAQSQMGGAFKATHEAKIKGTSKSGKDFEMSYAYANLADALAALRQTLNANGICVIQETCTSSAQGIEVVTRLVHKSGQWIQARPLYMPVQGNAQAVGSAISYGRRYQLLGMVGLAAEDDDGEDATANAPKQPKRQTRPAAPRPAAKPADIGPRCTGKAEPIAIAIDELATELSGIIKKDKALIYRSAVKAAGLDLTPYGNAAPNPAGLLVEDGKAVKAKLEAKLAEVTRQPGDDGDDPTGEAAP